MDVRAGRAAGPAGPADDPGAAGIAALAREPRPRRRGRPRDDADRGAGLGARRPAAAADPGGCRAGGGGAGRFGELFAGIYLRRTLSLWVLWFCAYLHHLRDDRLAAEHHAHRLSPAGRRNRTSTASSSTSPACSCCWSPRSPSTASGASAPIAGASCSPPCRCSWSCFVPNLGALGLAALATLAFAAMGMIPGSLGMYTAENYPNHLRALGSGASSISQRLSSVVGPIIVGLILPPLWRRRRLRACSRRSR